MHKYRMLHHRLGFLPHTRICAASTNDNVSWKIKHPYGGIPMCKHTYNTCTWRNSTLALPNAHVALSSLTALGQQTRDVYIIAVWLRSFLFTSLSEIRRLSDVSLSYENTAAMDAIDRFTRLCVVVGEPDGAWRLEGWQRTQIHHHRHMALFIRFQFGCLLFFGKTKVKLAFATHFRCTHAECIKRWWHTACKGDMTKRLNEYPIFSRNKFQCHSDVKCVTQFRPFNECTIFKWTLDGGCDAILCVFCVWVVLDWTYADPKYALHQMCKTVIGGGREFATLTHTYIIHRTPHTQRRTYIWIVHGAGGRVVAQKRVVICRRLARLIFTCSHLNSFYLWEEKKNEERMYMRTEYVCGITKLLVTLIRFRLTEASARYSVGNTTSTRLCVCARVKGERWDGCFCCCAIAKWNILLRLMPQRCCVCGWQQRAALLHSHTTHTHKY